MLIINEPIIRLCICMDLFQGFFIYMKTAVLSDVLIEQVDDLFFQITS